MIGRNLGRITAPSLLGGLRLSFLPNHHEPDSRSLECLSWEHGDNPHPPVPHFGSETRAGPTRVPLLSLQPITEWPTQGGSCKTLGIPSPVGQATLTPASSWRWLFLLLAIAPECLRRPVQDSTSCSARKLWRQPTDPIPTGTLPRLWIAFNCIACSLSIFEPEAFLVRNPPKYAYTPESAHNQHAYVFSPAPPATKDPPSIPSATRTINPLIARPRNFVQKGQG